MEGATKVIVIGSLVVLAVVVLFFAGSLGGCRPHRLGRGDLSPPFCRKGFHHRFSHKNMPEHVLSHMDRHVEELNLTEAQKAQYEEIRLRLRDHLLDGAEKRKQAVQDLKQAMKAENPDLPAMAASIKERMHHIPAHMGKNLDLFVEFYNILDQEQKAQVIKHFQKKLDCV
jgi:Spy/CpxP family protein refolding chaperone